MSKTAFALGAHPDDIEFLMAGTLILLKDAGYEIHYMNLANGNCGSTVYTRPETARVREKEGRAAADLIGAVFHPSLVSDLEIFYDKETLAKLGAVMREVNPEILLLLSLNDYMEDHMNSSRLGVSAAFCLGMKNFPTRPTTDAVDYDCTIYHTLPVNGRDQLRRRVWAEMYVDVSSVVTKKWEMLACHKSQKEWLDYSQGRDSYLQSMKDLSREMGTVSGQFEYAEAWRRHSHLGFSAKDHDPLTDALGDKVFIDEDYRRWLEEKPWK